MGFAATSQWSTKGAAVTLSGSNLIATVTVGTGSTCANNFISGPVYFEQVIGATLTGSARVGICNPYSFVMTTLVGVDLWSCGYNATGTVLINNVTVATIASYTANDNIGVAFNPATNLIWFRKNGGNWNNDVIGNQNPVGNVGGISTTTIGYGNFAPAWGGSATSSTTAKFASASWTYTAPTGYVSNDTLGVVADNGEVASTSATFSTYATSINAPINSVQKTNGVVSLSSATFSNYKQVFGTVVSNPKNISAIPERRDTQFTKAWYGAYTMYWNTGSPTVVAGQVQENGVPVAGKKVFLYDHNVANYLGTGISDSNGNFAIKALGSTSTFAVAVDPPYRAIVYDRITPIAGDFYPINSKQIKSDGVSNRLRIDGSKILRIT